MTDVLGVVVVARLTLTPGRTARLFTHIAFMECSIPVEHESRDCGLFSCSRVRREAAARGYVWGAHNLDRMAAMHTATRSPQSHGGPTTDGRHWIGTGFRRYAAPAP